MIPDRKIRKMVKAYDHELDLKWNAKKGWFELWRKPLFRSPQLITPITQSIYDESAPLVFAPLDERLLWWIYAADSYRGAGPKKNVLEGERRWKEAMARSDMQRHRENYEKAKEFWQVANQFSMTSNKKKNGKPKFENYEKTPWIAPDIQTVSNSRMFRRSKANALQYNYKRK